MKMDVSELTLAILREIGTVSDVRGKAAAGPGPRLMANNAHLHLPPNFSAFTTVKQSMELAAAQNCRIVGASNYYDYRVYGEFAAEARGHNVFPLFGLEIICMLEDLRVAGIKINDPGNPGKMYICGKAITRFDPMTAEARRILGIMCGNDAQLMSKMVERMAHLLAERGLPNRLNADAVIDMIVKRHGSPRDTVFIQERHVAQAFQEYIFAHVPPPSPPPAGERLTKIAALLGAAPKMKSAEDFVGLQNDLRSHLMKAGKPAYIDETFMDFDSAVRLIHELGGFVSYPTLADGNSPICPFEDPIEKFIVNLKERNIHAIELITGRNTQAVAIKYAKALRAAGLVVSAGTEHNTLDLIPFDPVCLKNEPVPADLKAIFYEGACVIAAHQFLTAHGEMGYVDVEGRLNPKYASQEARIADLARLGDTVFRSYLKMN
jgi:hypothetical protein